MRVCQKYKCALLLLFSDGILTHPHFLWVSAKILTVILTSRFMPSFVILSEVEGSISKSTKECPPTGFFDSVNSAQNDKAPNPSTFIRLFVYSFIRLFVYTLKFQPLNPSTHQRLNVSTHQRITAPV